MFKRTESMRTNNIQNRVGISFGLLAGCLMAAALFGHTDRAAANMGAMAAAGFGRIAFNSVTGGCPAGQNVPGCPPAEHQFNDPNDDTCSTAPISPRTGDHFHVDIATGNVWTEVPILTTYGGGEECLNITFTYNSLYANGGFDDKTGLGSCWRHNQKQSVFLLDPVIDPNGTITETVYRCLKCEDGNPHGYELCEGAQPEGPCSGFEMPGTDPNEDNCPSNCTCCRTPFQVSHTGPVETIPPKAVLVDGNGRQQVFFLTQGGPVSPGYGDKVLCIAAGCGISTETDELYAFTDREGNQQIFKNVAPFPEVQCVLSRTITPRGLTTRYIYDSVYKRRLTRIIDGYGRKVDFVYETVDGRTRLQKIVHPAGEGETVFEYENVGTNSFQLKRITDPHGDYKAFDYDPNILGRIIRERLKNGTIYECSYAPIQIGSDSYEARTLSVKKLDDTLEQVAQVRAHSFPSNWTEPPRADYEHQYVTVVDGRGQEWQYTRDQWGGLLSRRLASDNTYVTAVEFDGDDHNLSPTSNFARINSISRPGGSTTYFEWENHGRLTRERTVILSGGGCGATIEYLTSYEYNNAFGLLSKKTQPDGGEWNYTYYSNGDVEYVYDPAQNYTHYQYEYYAADEGRPSGVTELLPGRLKKVTQTDRNGYKAESSYDGSGNLCQKKVYTDLAETAFLLTEYESDGMGRRTQEKVTRGDSTYATTRYQYDEMGRLTDVIENYEDGTHDTGSDADLITHYDYDGKGQTIGVTNPRGVKTQYNYNYRNQLTEVIEDATGTPLSTTYVRDGNDNVASMTDAKGHTTTYTYDSADFVQIATDDIGYQTRYTRNEMGKVTRLDRESIAGSGFQPSAVAVYTATYDGLGRMTSKTIGQDPTLCIDYGFNQGGTPCGCTGSGSSYPRKVTYLAGTIALRTTYYEVDALGRLQKIIRKAAGNTAGEEQSGDAVTAYEYDPEGNLLNVTGPQGESTVFTYDGAGRRMTKRVATGAQDLVTEFTYDGADNLLSVTQPTGHVVHYEYDPADRLRKILDTEGTIAEFTRDESGNVLTRKNGVDAIWGYDYDPFDRVIKVTDPVVESGEDGDRVTKYAYDAVGNLTDSTKFFGDNNDKNITTHYEYDEIDRLTMVVEDYHAPAFPCQSSGQSSGGGGGDGHIITDPIPEDPTSQPTSQPNTVQAPEPTPTTNSVTTYEYNGRYLKAIYDPDCNVTLYTHDAAGRVATVRYPLATENELVHYSYALNNNRITRTDQKGQDTDSYLDEFGRVTSRSYSKDSGLTNLHRDEFTYDLSGRLTEATSFEPITNVLKKRTSWSRSYDLAGRPTSETQRFFEGTSETPAGEYETQMSYVLDPSAHTLTQAMCYPSCGDRDVEHVWDGRGRLISANAGESSGVDWTFDNADRRETATRRHPGAAITSYTYDADDRLTQLIHLAGPIAPGPNVLIEPAFNIQYGYDADGNRLYTLHGTVDFGNRSEVYEHDRRNRLRVMNRGTVTFNEATGAATIEQPDFYTNDDEISKLKQKEDWVDLDRRGNWKDYRDSIDGAGRRETRVANGVNAYTSIDPQEPDPETGLPATTLDPVSPVYDANGNLTFDPLARSAIANPCAPITSSGPVPFECRANNACAPAKAGCGVGQEYVYDAENRVVSIHRDTNDMSGPNYPFSTILKEPKLLAFTYDALGRRVETKEYVDAATGQFSAGLPNDQAPLRTVRHVYVGLETIQDWWCGTGNPACGGSPEYRVKQQYLWGDSARFPEPIAMLTPFEAQTPEGEQPVEEKAWHYLHDVLGSVIGIVDENGTLVERYTYDPYGKPFIEKWDSTANENEGDWVAVAESNTGMPYSAYGNPWMWTGQRYDAAVGLYAFWARTYSPTLGRWLQRDPIEYEGGSINLYEYIRSKPLQWIDPFGLAPTTQPTEPPPPTAEEITAEYLRGVIPEELAKWMAEKMMENSVRSGTGNAVVGKAAGAAVAGIFQLHGYITVWDSAWKNALPFVRVFVQDRFRLEVNQCMNEVAQTKSENEMSIDCGPDNNGVVRFTFNAGSQCGTCTYACDCRGKIGSPTKAFIMCTNSKCNGFAQFSNPHNNPCKKFCDKKRKERDEKKNDNKSCPAK